MSREIAGATSGARAAMGSANRLKLGLFGANCSSGRAVTMVPERWSGNWPDCVRLAQMADRAGIEFMLPIGRWKGYGGDDRLSGRHVRDRDLGLRPARQDRAAGGVRHRARAADPAADRRQGVRHRRPYRRGALWPQPRLRLERGRVRDVRRHLARPRGALCLRPGVARCRQAGLVAARGFRLRGPVHQGQGRARQAQALWRHPPADHERRRIADRPSLRDPQLRRAVLERLARHLLRGDGAARRERKGAGAAMRPRDRRLYRGCR